MAMIAAGWPRRFRRNPVSWLTRLTRYGPTTWLRTGCHVLWGALVLSFLAAIPAAAQQPRPPFRSGPAPTEPTLNVGFSTAQPGDPIDIPITLSGAEQPQTGSIAVELTFPKPALAFVRADAGLAGEMAEANIQGKVQDAPNDSKLSLLTISVSAKKPVKPGILAYLKFRVPTEAKKGRVQFKVLSVKAATLGGASQPLNKGRDGAVEVYDRDEEVPQIGCFFFTH